MTCSDEILIAIKKLISHKGSNVFSVPEVIQVMVQNGTTYKKSTISTHISSRMCSNAPDNHGVTYSDLVRVDKGLYRLKETM